MAALLSVGALALTGCKQSVGERCEQASDCASGICGEVGASGATSATGRMCVASGSTVVAPPVDTGTPSPTTDASEDTAQASDALDAPASEASGAGPEAGADVVPSGDGSTDSAEAGHD